MSLNENKVKISVIIPVYNSEKYLPQCVDSLISQTLPEIEIILIDDGSTDSCGKMCDEYAKLDDRIKVIHKENAGAGIARNAGIEIASGEFVTFVDSDDYLDSDMYEVMYGRTKEAGADFCSCGYRRVLNGETVMTHVSGKNTVYEGKEALREAFLDFLGPDPDAPSDKIVIGNGVWSSLFSIDIILKHNIRFHSEREVISEDSLFKMEYLCRSGRICLINKILYNYRWNNASLSQSYKADHMERLVKLYQEQLRILKDNTSLYEDGILRIQRTFLMNTRAALNRRCSTASSYGEARAVLLDIMSTPELITILREYPWKRNPFKHKMFYYCLKYRLPFPLYIICRINTYFTFGVPAYKRR